MILPIIAILIIVFFPNIVLFYQFGTLIPIIPSVLLIGALICLLISYRTYLLRIIYSMVLFFELPKFNLSVAILVGIQIDKLLPGAYFWLIIFAILLNFAVILIVLYGFFFGWKHLVVRPFNFNFKTLPHAFDGLKIVQISDLHLGSFMTRVDFIEKLVEKINSLKADLIVFTGDLINMNPYEVEPFKEILQKIHSKYPIFAVLGNHDYCIHSKYGKENRPQAVELLCDKIKEIGWKLLKNESEILTINNESLAIIGIENDSPHYDCSHGDLEKAMKNLPDGIFKLLLSHDPTFWRRKVLAKTDIQLTLSGHTHAMQLKIGNFSPSKWRYAEWGGSFTQKGQKLLVSLGIGGSVAFRFGAWPEIDLITLHS